MTVLRRLERMGSCMQVGGVALAKGTSKSSIVTSDIIEYYT